MIRLATFFYGFMFGFAVLLTHLWGNWSHWLPRIDNAPWIMLPSWIPLSEQTARIVMRYLEDTGLALVLGLLIVAMSQWMTPRWEATRRLAKEMSAALGSLRWRDAFYLAILSGVAEEALFRATLQPLASHMFGTIPGLVSVSLFFGLIHTGPKKHFLLWTIFAIAFGFLAGSLFLWRGGLFLPTLLHITVNFFNLKFLADHEKH